MFLNKANFEAGGKKLNRGLANAGYVLALIGGILLIIFGLAGIFGIFWLIFAPVFSLTIFFWGIIIFVLGIICAAGARFVWNIPTAILLILCGVGASLLGVWFTAWLIIIGAILGLLSRL